MIVDSSVLVAILFNEPEAQSFLTLLMQGPASMSAANYFEAGMVVDRKTLDDIPRRAFDTLIQNSRLRIVDVTRSQADAARSAHRRFGKGNHPAQLNFGDCFAYALARETGETLLFKGNDFSQTDIISAA